MDLIRLDFQECFSYISMFDLEIAILAFWLICSMLFNWQRLVDVVDEVRFFYASRVKLAIDAYTHAVRFALEKEVSMLICDIYDTLVPHH